VFVYVSVGDVRSVGLLVYSVGEVSESCVQYGPCNSFVRAIHVHPERVRERERERRGEKLQQATVRLSPEDLGWNESSKMKH